MFGEAMDRGENKQATRQVEAASWGSWLEDGAVGWSGRRLDGIREIHSDKNLTERLRDDSGAYIFSLEVKTS